MTRLYIITEFVILEEHVHAVIYNKRTGDRGFSPLGLQTPDEKRVQDLAIFELDADRFL